MGVRDLSPIPLCALHLVLESPGVVLLVPSLTGKVYVRMGRIRVLFSSVFLFVSGLTAVIVFMLVVVNLKVRSKAHS